MNKITNIQTDIKGTMFRLVGTRNRPNQMTKKIIENSPEVRKHLFEYVPSETFKAALVKFKPKEFKI